MPVAVGGYGTGSISQKGGFAAAIEQAEFRAVAEMIRLTVNALNGGTRGIANGLEAFAEAYYKKLVNVTELQAIHARVAENARAAVLAEFDITVNRGFPNTGDYQTRPGRLGGRIRGVLEQKGVVAQATPEGIQYVNQAILNSEVAFWRRLNFGAGSRGAANRPHLFPVLFAGVSLGPIGFRAGPSPAFTMPVGQFVGGTPGQFHVSRFWASRPRVQTAGIAAREFLDAGVAVIAAELPVEYTRYLNEALLEGKTALAETLASYTGGAPF